MKTLKLFFTTCLVAISTITQAQSTEGTTEALKAQQPCAMVTYNVSADVMEKALVQRLEKNKLSYDKSKGFKVYQGVVLPELTTDKVDIYTKVEGKKDNCTVYVLVSKGYDNFVSSKTDEKTFANMKVFLNSMQETANQYQYGLDAEEQANLIKKADKTYNSSVSDGKDLESDKAKIEKKIADNKTEQDNNMKALEAAKAKLVEIKSKIK
jgi:hypothetical protein